MSDIRIIGMPAADSVEDNDFLALDNNTVAQSNDDTTAGTRKIRAKDFIDDNLTKDETPTEDSTNPVESGGVYDALESINDKVSQLEVLGTASGSIATFSDGSANPLKDLKFTITPVQSGSGDPYPAGGGKNKLNLSDISGTATSRYYIDTVTDYVLEEGVTYTFSINVQSSITPYNFSVGVGDVAYRSDISTKTNFNNGRVSITFTPTSTHLATYNKFAFRVPRYASASDFTYSLTEAQLEIGSTATPYAPYSNIRPISGWSGVNIWVQAEADPTAEATYNVSWQTEAGTVYGGSIDVTSGVLTVDKVCQVYNGEENLSLSAYHYFAIPVTAPHKLNTDGISNLLLFSNNTSLFPRLAQGNTTSNYWLWLDSNDPMYDNVNAVKQWLAQLYLDGTPLTIVYPLATPTTYQLTPTQVNSLLADNNIFADVGDCEKCQYVRDLNICINNLING